MPSATAAANPFLLAADASPQLLPLVRATPSLATHQDESGYSLVHALTSYNHLELLRALVAEFHTPLDLADEDGETALFVAESAAAARCLVDELGGGAALAGVRNAAGQTAEEKMRAEVAEGLAEAGVLEAAEYLAAFGAGAEGRGGAAAPEMPPGMRLRVAAVAEDEMPAEVDQDFRRRIEQLAARDDFAGEGGQRELKELVQDAVRDIGGAEERDVRRRLD